MKNGNVLRPALRANTRLVFRVLSGTAGEPLSTWNPDVQVRPGTAGISRQNLLSLEPIHRIGEPVAATSRSPADEHFRVNGIPMPVLAVSGLHLFLRDPMPSLGVRMIQTDRDSYESLFVGVEIRPARIETSPPTKRLTISVIISRSGRLVFLQDL
jgi:hypothetical protein